MNSAPRKAALVGVPEASELTGIHSESLRKMVDAGQVPGMKVGRCYRIPRWWIDAQLNGPSSTAA